MPGRVQLVSGRAGGGWERWSEVGWDGTFELELPPGRYRLRGVGGEGEETERVTLELAPAALEEVVLQLRVSWPLSGILRDALGRPLAGEILLVAEPEGAARTRRVACAEGGFSLPRWPAGATRVVAHAPGHARARREFVHAQPGAHLELTLPRAASMRGRFRDPQGAITQGRLVVLQEGKRRASLGRAEDGAFELAPLMPGRVQLYAWSEAGVAMLDFELEAGQVLVQDVSLEPGLRLLGSLGSANGSAPGLRVELRHARTGRRQRTTSDLSGRFELNSLLPGESVLRVLASTGAPLMERELDLPAWGSLDLNLALPLTQALDSGRR